MPPRSSVCALAYPVPPWIASRLLSCPCKSSAISAAGLCHDRDHDHGHDPFRLLTTFNFSPDGVVGCHFDGLSLDLALKQAWSSVPATTLDPRARSRANPLSQLSVLLCDRRTWPGCRDPWLNASGRPLSLLLAPVPQVLGGTAGCILGVGAL